MAKGRPTPFDDAAYAEGRAAREGGISFQGCPYFFITLGVTQEVFERDYRAKMNGWTYGWIDADAGLSIPRHQPQSGTDATTGERE